MAWLTCRYMVDDYDEKKKKERKATYRKLLVLRLIFLYARGNVHLVRVITSVLPKNVVHLIDWETRWRINWKFVYFSIRADVLVSNARDRISRWIYLTIGYKKRSKQSDNLLGTFAVYFLRVVYILYSNEHFLWNVFHPWYHIIWKIKGNPLCG